ncbi:protein maelstrom homolog isoform X2 [Hemicordylus capensis]|uniref:protein maelstrom homolog isoform X2 n=1 Tax=Hemicordylus capensis TaxID=884348 RepID=UPI0023032ACD|nr:protein maelstrom homolog isoform X2 [Hemicordylus capensis]
MPNRKGARNAYYFFVLEKLPALKRRGLPVTGVADAIPHCSADWAMLTEEQKEKYVEMARQWKAKKSEVTLKKSLGQVAPPPPIHTQKDPVANLASPTGEHDQVVLETTFYFLNIFSHGVLPPHTNQRFLPCEIGCVKYSLKDGIIEDFHHFIDPGDASHRIPISGFEFATTEHSVLHDLYMFIQPRRNSWPPVYCKSDDQFRVNWCLKHMAREAGRVNELELLSVEDLVVELYHQKFQKEPSKTWVCNTLDASMWDYSSNTRCKWHEENDVLFCALGTCKKIAYCISNSLASMYDIPLTASHLPLRDKEFQSTVNPKTIVLDAGRFQKVRAGCAGNDRYFRSFNQDQDATSSGDHPSGVKTMCEATTRCGRGIARFLDNISKLSSS